MFALSHQWVPSDHWQHRHTVVAARNDVCDAKLILEIFLGNNSRY